MLISPDGPYGKRFLSEGFRWVALPMNRRSLNVWSELILLKQLFFIYRSEKPDLVHHFTIKCVIYGSIAAALAGVRRRINAVTGLGHVFIDKGFRAFILRPVVLILFRLFLQAGFCRLILQNPDDRELFLNKGLANPEIIRLIRGSGVNTDLFRPAVKPLKENRPFKVLLATRLLKEKGIEEYVNAARIIKDDGYAVDFLIAGLPDIGNPSSFSKEEIEQWQSEGVIIYIGHVEDMPSLLKRVDIVVLPSYREGTPKILLEAASCALPVIATDVPGCREVVENKINGLLIPVRNSDKLVSALKYLFNNREERVRMGNLGRDKVLKEFDERIVIIKTMAVYDEVLFENKGVAL